ILFSPEKDADRGTGVLYVTGNYTQTKQGLCLFDLYTTAKPKVPTRSDFIYITGNATLYGEIKYKVVEGSDKLPNPSDYTVMRYTKLTNEWASDPIPDSNETKKKTP